MCASYHGRVARDRRVLEYLGNRDPSLALQSMVRVIGHAGCDLVVASTRLVEPSPLTMRLPPRSEYPKEITIPCKDGGTQIYSIRWVKKFKEKTTLAECDPGSYEIRIKIGQTKAELFQCFIHEVLHAIEFEFPIDLSHRNIYKLEEALFQLLRLNV